ncbi:MAG TPA: mechanosensitive ion channel family protein, partial [Terriglobales bacterium]|nr:mechanosensitive ion channel family protein [Terriglobales bacterium]
ALLIIGRWLIRLTTKLVASALNRQRLDPTIVGYIRSSIGVLLNVVLIVAILGFFGVQTATFAALLAGVGIAIGAAWSGLLSNLAAGVFLVMLRPFKVGDMVSAAGVTGVVTEIGLFACTINTADNVCTTIGNAKILSDNIQNFTANPYRRVDLTAQLAHSTDHLVAIQALKSRLLSVRNVLANPAPDVELLQFSLAGPVLAVRPYCHNDHYWQVYFDTNKLILETFHDAGFDVPEQHYALHNFREVRRAMSTAA